VPKPPESLAAAIRTRIVPATPTADARAAAEAVVRGGGESVLGIVFFGSRKTAAGPNVWSAYDLFVLTEGYRDFYRTLAATGATKRSPALVAALNAILPPNQVSVPVTSDGAAPRTAKCAVIALDALLRETSSRRRDHFCVGRLFQPTEVVFARDGAVREQIVDAIVSAHTETYVWARPWLPERFDVEAYCRTLLRVSLGREIRPEPEGRAEALWQAQREYLHDVFGVLLAELAATGELQAVGEGAFALARPVGFAERLRIDLYFRWSLLRATARWLKYMVTFEGWLDYIRRKAERHTGQEIVLTQREQRWPLLFLWPRLFRYLRHKDKRRQA
jgi:hypothetical protein